MNILLYIFGSLDTPNASLHLIKTLIEDILRKGHNVHLIQSKMGGPLVLIPEEIGKYKNFTYDAVKMKKVNKKKLIQRYFLGVVNSYKARKYIKKKKEWANVSLVYSCPTAFFQIRSVKKYTKSPIVYLMQDFFPGSSIASGLIKNKLLISFFNLLERKAYKMVNYFTVNSEDSKKLLINKGVEENKITVVYNWFNDEAIKKIQKKDNFLFEKLDISREAFIIQYAGGMGFVFDYESIIDIAFDLTSHEEIQFHMIGNGSLKNEFIALAKSKELKNIFFHNMQPLDIISYVYSACDISYIPLKKGIIGNSTPSKVALLMQCKIPIILSIDEDSAYYKMINDNKLGIAVSNTNNKESIEAIKFFYENPNIAIKFANNAYDFAQKNFTRKVCTNKIISVLENV